MNKYLESYMENVSKFNSQYSGYLARKKYDVAYDTDEVLKDMEKTLSEANWSTDDMVVAKQNLDAIESGDLESLRKIDGDRSGTMTVADYEPDTVIAYYIGQLVSEYNQIQQFSRRGDMHKEITLDVLRGMIKHVIESYGGIMQDSFDDRLDILLDEVNLRSDVLTWDATVINEPEQYPKPEPKKYPCY